MKRSGLFLQTFPPLAIAILISLSTTTGSADTERNDDEGSALPLPRWSERELTTFRESLNSIQSADALFPGNSGQPEDFNQLLLNPVHSGARLDGFFGEKPEELSPRLKAEDMRLFLPESILGLPDRERQSSAPIPTPTISLKDVTPEFLTACKNALSGEYLIDPDALIPEIESHSMERFLEFHARDSAIPLYVIVMDRDRKLPSNIELNEFAARGLATKTACLLVYPLGEPWRARLFANQSVHDLAPGEFLRETMRTCLEEAMLTSDTNDQLHRYSVHLSTRLFWVQKNLGTPATPDASPRNEQAISEVAAELKLPLTRKMSSLETIAVMGLTGLLAAGAGWHITRRLRERGQLRQQNRVWVLPEPETIPRLGGAFSGGGGGMIRYS